MRLFVAVELPEAVRAAVTAAVAPLRAAAGELRWTPAENLHLTLAFLGERAEELVPTLATALQGAAAGVRRFGMALGGVGAFPALARPRVVWVGVEAPDELAALQGAVVGALQPHGYVPEARPFRPHLTIARTRTRRPGAVAALDAAARTVVVDASFQVTEIALMQSTLGPHGARYRRVAALALGRAA